MHSAIISQSVYPLGNFAGRNRHLRIDKLASFLNGDFKRKLFRFLIHSRLRPADEVQAAADELAALLHRFFGDGIEIEAGVVTRDSPRFEFFK